MKDFVIPFIGLKEGKHQFEFEIDKKFFEIYPYEDISDSDVQVHLDFEKKSTMLELFFTASGNVQVACDLTNELYRQAIAANLNLVVKFGPEYNDDLEDILIIPHEAYEVDVSQYIYEMIVLAIPAKRIHPGVLDGTLKSDILDKLKELQPKEKQTNNKSSDPRWEKLKGLLTDKENNDGTS